MITAESGIERVLIPEEMIQSRVRQLAERITEDYKGQIIVMIGVLTGAVMFLSDLARAISLPMEMDFIACSSYGHRTTTSGEVRMIKDLSHPVEGRHVLLVEDIIDSGLTMRYLQDTLRNRQCASLRTVALLDKPSGRKTIIQADYIGFTIENHFVVGYGLDYAGLYRNLSYIGVLKP
jgi:hypoxanthine phosphoribosyltransferase